MNDINQQRNEGVRILEVGVSHVRDLIYIGQAVNLSPWTAEGYIDELKNSNSVMLRLVSDENKTIGFIVGRLIGTEGGLTEGEIYNIAIKESEQRKGNGQLLFNAFIEECRQRQVSTIWLEVRESNHKAISFYTRNGFEKIQRRKHFYENPREHAWLMRAVLK